MQLMDEILLCIAAMSEVGSLECKVELYAPQVSARLVCMEMVSSKSSVGN